MRDAAPRLLTEEQILAWVDAHEAATGGWPTRNSGQLTGTDETWIAIDGSLKQGNRGLESGSSLAKLLAEHRGVPNVQDLPSLKVEQILAWADTHKATKGEWPKKNSGQIERTDWPNQKSGAVTGTEETWAGIDTALSRGSRDLGGGLTLGKLLSLHRGARNIKDLSPLTINQVIAWVDEHRGRERCWPNQKSGRERDRRDVEWNQTKLFYAVVAIYTVGSSLANLRRVSRCAKHRGSCPLTILQILAWADAYKVATGKWPNRKSGLVTGTDETWGRNRGEKLKRQP